MARTNRKKPYQPKRKQYTSLSTLVSEMTQEGVFIDVFDGLSIEANGYRYGMSDSIVSMEPIKKEPKPRKRK